MIAVAVWLTAVSVGYGQAVYPGSPDWVSGDTPVSTGAALVDIDRDGWLDFVVANGNDMAQQRLAVYYNQGDGTYPATPDWQSADIAYNGHLDVADVNGDGWTDVAVAHLGAGSTFEPIARLYLNNGGTLSSLPDWTADVDGNAFGVAFGDMNNDGRPDLAVGTGWAYSPQQFYANYVYLNVAGALESSASWSSADTYHYQGVVWVDANQDGWLDLAAAASGSQSRMYLNLGGTLETTASWHLTDVANQDAIMMTAGDVTGDGRPDLFLADNDQLGGGSGRFRQYNGLPVGTFSQMANWTYAEGYCSAVALADVNADGLLDLATGGWWDPTRVFFNQGSGFDASAGWSSSVTSVVEKVVFGDIDKNGLRTVVEVIPPDGGRRLFHLAQRPIQRVVSVSRDGVALLPSEYVCNREHGWVSVGTAPLIGLEVTYACSSNLDMAVTNWDDDVGNFVYYSDLSIPGDANCDGRADEADVALLVLLLVDRSAYDAAYPDCDADTFCDLNGDSRLDGLDIQGLIDLILGDCNGNGRPDDDDLFYGTSADCNENDVPDECDIADGLSEDCTANGIPDECEPDCNFNGEADSCDIDTGTSQDIDENGVPDECQDVTPPTGLAWAEEPHPISSTEIRMAGYALEEANPPVEYAFEGFAGGHDRDWDADPVYVDSGLGKNNYYQYYVVARDSSPQQNETGFDLPIICGTAIETPSELTFGAITQTSIEVFTAHDEDAGGLFTNLTFYDSGLFFEVTTMGGTPVGGGDANTWVQYTSQSVGATGLTPGTTYRFRVKARNLFGNETDWYPLDDPAPAFVEQATASPRLD